MILGRNGDDWAKGQYTKLKRESWNAPTLIKARLNLLKPDITSGTRSSEIAPKTLGLFT